MEKELEGRFLIESGYICGNTIKNSNYMRLLTRIVIFSFVFSVFCPSCQKPNDNSSICQTGIASDVTQFSAVLSGIANLSDDMTGQITMGIICSKDPSPSKNNGRMETTDEIYSGNKFSVSFLDLEPSTKYYYKAFVLRNDVYFFGDTKEFNTADLDVSVETLQAKIQNGTVHFYGKCVKNGYFKYDVSPHFYYAYGNLNIDQLLKEGKSLSVSLSPDGTFSAQIDVFDSFKEITYVAWIEVEGIRIYGNIICDSGPNSGTSPSESKWEVTVRELSSSIRGQKIYGELHFPKDKKGSLPLIIYSHGLGGTYKDCIAYADSAARHGYAAYVFDFRGGGSRASKSEGDVFTMSIFTEADDLEAVWGTISKQSFYDASRVFLCGSSQGGLVSAMVGARHSSEISGMVLLSPAFNIPEYVRLLYHDYDSVPEKVNLFGFTFGKKYADGLFEYDPYKSMPSFRNPVLILHGTADMLVPVSYSEKAALTYPDATLEKMKGQPHGFNSDGIPYAAYRIVQYFNSIK